MDKIGKISIQGEIGKGGMGVVYRALAPYIGRTVRGGSWTNGMELIRSANRSSENPDSRLKVLGFRVAMEDR